MDPFKLAPVTAREYDDPQKTIKELVAAVNAANTNFRNLAHLIQGNIDNVNIQTGGIVKENLAEGSVDEFKLVDLSVTAGKVADAAIATRHVADAAIKTAQIAEGVIVTAHIGLAQITDALIDTLSANKINGGTITGVTINVTTDLTVGRNIYLKPGVNQDKSIIMHGTANISFVSDGDYLKLEALGGLIMGSHVNFVAGATGLSTEAVGSHNHGIPNGTVLATAGGGSVVWTASGGHSHSVE